MQSSSGIRVRSGPDDRILVQTICSLGRNNALQIWLPYLLPLLTRSSSSLSFCFLYYHKYNHHLLGKNCLLRHRFYLNYICGGCDQNLRTVVVFEYLFRMNTAYKFWREISDLPTYESSHSYLQQSEDRGSTVVKVLCYKSEGRWFDPSWCHWNFSLT